MTQVVALDHKGNISDAVDAELAEHANEIRKLGKRAIGDVIEVGKHLIAAKKLAGHGNWLPWLEREFGWASESTALRFMRAAELAKSVSLTDLNIDLSAIHLLAAPSTPVEVVEEVVALDKKITTKDVVKANTTRKRNYAPASKPKSAKPVRDPIDAIVDKMRGPLCDGNKWRAKHVIATTLKVAPTAVQEALDTLEEGKDYVTRARGDVIEFQFKRTAVADAKDSRIAELEARIIERDAEITDLKNQVAELKAMLADQAAEITAPSPAMVH